MSELNKLFEKLYIQKAPSWSVEQDEDGSYKYHATQSAFVLFESQQAEIDRLNSVLDERTKEWLQAIECGTYFENVAKPLKAENDELQKQLACCREENKALLAVNNSIDRECNHISSNTVVVK